MRMRREGEGVYYKYSVNELRRSLVATMEFIVDVQGFKEVAISPLEEDAVPVVFLFEPP